MVVAVSAVRVMQVAAHRKVGVVTVGNRFVAAGGAVNMSGRVLPARVRRGNRG